MLNLEPFNGQFHCPNLKMETLESVTLGLRQGDWMVSVDL